MPTRRAAIIALLLATAVPIAARSAWARPLTPRDLDTLDRASGPRRSADGKRILFDLRSTDWAANKGVHAVWLVCADCADPAPKPLAQPASDPAWAPDGSAVYFLSARSGSTQVWRAGIDANGFAAAAEQVTKLPLPDGHTLVVSQAVFPDCDTPACTRARLEARGAQKTTFMLYDHLFVRHWDEWEDGTRNHLFALALDARGLATGAPLPLMPHFDGDTPTKPLGGIEDFAISPDSKTLVFSARLAGTTEPWSTNFDLYQVNLDGTGAARDLTAANPAWDAGPVFSPDGKILAYRAMRRPGFEADRFAIMLRDVGTGATHQLAPHWDRTPQSLAWSADGKALYATADQAGRALLFAINVRSGAVTPVTQAGTAGDVDAAGGAVTFTQSSLGSPNDIFVLRPAGARQMTHVNAAKLAGIDLAPYRQFSFAGWNGETVQGYVMQPVGLVAGRKYPVAFIVHGGPQGSFGDDWSYRWNPQTYAAAGFGVVFIDFHGSTGYGQAFTDSISGRWGDRPLEDLQKGWAAALARFPYLDGNRACALGASYGGYMIYWMAGIWNAPWKCLVDHDGVFDNRMMGYATEELWFSEWENGHATPWEKPANYERFNPIDHVADWRVPMLVIHNGHDYRIPLEQGLAAFTALQRKNVPSAFLTFPDENHWVLKPRNWLKRWTAK
jgi:acylaminoacyl-peptidase